MRRPSAIFVVFLLASPAFTADGGKIRWFNPPSFRAPLFTIDVQPAPTLDGTLGERNASRSSGMRADLTFFHLIQEERSYVATEPVPSTPDAVFKPAHRRMSFMAAATGVVSLYAEIFGFTLRDKLASEPRLSQQQR